MDYYVYHLKFDTPVHFGTSEHGGELEQADMAYPSDTLFSALCCELAAAGQHSSIWEWKEKAGRGQIILSDLMPFVFYGGETYYYLPRPVLLIELEYTAIGEDLEEVRKQAAIRKKQENLTYIRASRMEEYINAMKNGSDFIEPVNFGERILSVQSCQGMGVNKFLYYVGKFYFRENAGMYFVAGLEKHEDALELYMILRSLGFVGIGGKRSSGCGKFHLPEEPKLLSACKARDLSELSKLLADDKSPWQMCISSLIPSEADIHVVKESQYRMMKRSGFITPMDGEHEFKKNSVHILMAGSCFPVRLNGRVVSLGHSINHEVYRMGKGIYVGLPI